MAIWYNFPIHLAASNDRPTIHLLTELCWSMPMGLWPTILCIALMPMESPDAIAELVRQLGSDSYRVRETAMQELLRIGIAARPALQAGLRAEDPEIQQRCQKLLPLIRLADLQARIEKFLAAPESADASGLPGFARFNRLVAANKISRDWYIEMIQQHATILEQIESDPEEAPKVYRTFCQDFAGRRRVLVPGPTPVLSAPTERPDLTLFFLLGADPALRSNELPYIQISAILRMPTFTQSINNRAPENEPLRQLFIRWAEHQDHQTVLMRIFTLANTAEIPELLPMAVKHMQQKQMIARTRAYAALVVGRHGSKADIPKLETQLEDQAALTTVNLGGKRGTVEMRDVALAMCIQLAGEKLEDYGYDLTNTFPSSLTSYYQLGFSDDEKRQAALKKWRERPKP